MGISIHPTLSILGSSSSDITSQISRLDKEISKDGAILSSNSSEKSFLHTDDPAEVISIQKEIKSLAQQEKYGALLGNRQAKTKIQIEQVQVVAEELNALIRTVNTTNPMTGTAFHNLVRGHLSQIERIMNSNEAGDQTLSGVAIDTKPVKKLTELGQLPEGMENIDYSYYQGGRGDEFINLDKQTEINQYPVTGAHDAFAKVIQAARLCLTMQPNDIHAPALQPAARLCSEATGKDIPNALYKIHIETNNTKACVDAIPKKRIQLTERLMLASAENQIKALTELPSLQSSKQNTENIMIQNAKLERRFADAIGSL
ncbi:MAG: hypothetical protein V4482_02210 [Pseudomonadota bacterium]